MINYPLVKMLYTVFDLSCSEIGEALGESTYVINLAVTKDLKLTEKDRHQYKDLPLQERVKIFDLERLRTFQTKYIQIEAAILDRMLTLLGAEDGELNATSLHRMASTLNMLRQPAYKDYIADDTAGHMTSMDCEARATNAANRLEELRRMRIK